MPFGIEFIYIYSNHIFDIAGTQHCTPKLHVRRPVKKHILFKGWISEEVGLENSKTAEQLLTGWHGEKVQHTNTHQALGGIWETRLGSMQASPRHPRGAAPVQHGERRENRKKQFIKNSSRLSSSFVRQFASFVRAQGVPPSLMSMAQNFSRDLEAAGLVVRPHVSRN